jgi:hypothetical protein
MGSSITERMGFFLGDRTKLFSHLVVVTDFNFLVERNMLLLRKDWAQLKETRRGVQIIRLPTIENLPTATELPSTAYRKKKSKIRIKNNFKISVRSVIDKINLPTVTDLTMVKQSILPLIKTTSF